MSSHPETRSITIHVSEKVYTGLVENGRKRGYTPSLLAKLLFEAGYASSVGKGADDPILAASVAKSLARRAPIATQPKVTVAVPAEPIVRPVAVPVPVIVPVPIAVPVVREPAPAMPLEVPVETPQPMTPEATILLQPLIGAAAANLMPEVSCDPEPAPQEVVRPRPAPAALQRSIRSLSAAGNSVREIARTLGCREAYVRDVIAGRAA